jgi:hypothetical protein
LDILHHLAGIVIDGIKASIKDGQHQLLDAVTQAQASHIIIATIERTLKIGVGTDVPANFRR